MTVAVRRGLLAGRGDAGTASLVVLSWAFCVTLLAALPRHDAAGAWRFFLAGLLAPGISQLLFTLAVSEVGASRSSATVGVAPLVALGIAFGFLHEPVRVWLIVGGLAIVAGGVLLASERDRPGHLRARGLLYGIGAAFCFAIRDNIVRALHAHGNPETVAAATILAGMLVAACAARRRPGRVELRVLAPAGALFGLSYIMLFEAYFRGRVSVVSPLVATETLWGVGLAAFMLERSERLRPRLLLGAGIIVLGGIVIGVSAAP